MTKTPTPKAAVDKIHLTNAALDEIATSRGQQIVLRGVIDPTSLPLLKIDEYQREALPLSALSRLIEALRKGESLPDIELAMRGSNFDARGKGDEFWLGSDVYIIDGQQRRNAAQRLLDIDPNFKVRLGAMIHFGTSREWERERFAILNLERSKVSANVLLRNMRHQSSAMLTLYGLSYNEPKFALFERVCWKQAQGTKELITARTLASVVATLHAHRTSAFRNSLNELVPALDRQSAFVKLDRWRSNIIGFFDMVDEAWGLRSINFRDISLQVRANFLVQLALLISDHTNFWRGEHETELYIDTAWQHRFADFPLHDPSVVQLVTTTSSGYKGSAATLLYTFIRDHLNKGRSTNRLINRKDQEAAKAPKRFASFEVRNKSELEYSR